MYNDYSKFKIRVCKGTLSAPFIFQIVYPVGLQTAFKWRQLVHHNASTFHKCFRWTIFMNAGELC